MLVKIIWRSEKVILAERAYLFCFGEKCLSAKVINLIKKGVGMEYEANVEFIDTLFLQSELYLNNVFFIKERDVLGHGFILSL